MAMTFPSPGATTKLSPCGIIRNGFRKNHDMKRVRMPAPPAATVQPANVAASVTPAAVAMKGIPSLAKGMPTARSATVLRSLVLGLVDQLVLLQPGHHGAKPGANLFDRVSFAFGQKRIVDRTVGLIFQHPFLGKSAFLNFRKDLFH